MTTTTPTTRPRRRPRCATCADGDARAAERRGLGLDVSESFFEHRQPYFFDYVEDVLIEAYGVNTVRQGGLDVHTTIDPRLQDVGLDAMRGFEQTFQFTYQDLSAKLHASGHAQPVSCVDCHQPDTMALRVTRPGFVRGIQALAASDAFA